MWFTDVPPVIKYFESRVLKTYHFNPNYKLYDTFGSKITSLCFIK